MSTIAIGSITESRPGKVIPSSPKRNFVEMFFFVPVIGLMSELN